MKLSKSSVEQEGAILPDLADRFEGISLRSPLLSIYELTIEEWIDTAMPEIPASLLQVLMELQKPT
ncbi:hypothetical protein BO85DRAFT_449281 [Aspergillus piperis CBS 112811]|uniref:Uncharacterized protein n=1 Tax=Aspergillus piperis CBS 112811 TaxID=1448313 RepID=A0A8G1VM22_9EURO|nr:hypothetical protein BO85DRAFT_449281 [Aspergillus piperis CBS 112811]RAH58176.1 hypothetical protein BO85DRAFT_449281 [Aspergillus piperis CBS 112811]